MEARPPCPHPIRGWTASTLENKWVDSVHLRPPTLAALEITMRTERANGVFSVHGKDPSQNVSGSNGGASDYGWLTGYQLAAFGDATEQRVGDTTFVTSTTRNHAVL